MALADDLRAIEAGLPGRWDEARLRLVIRDDADCDRAAALLGPAMPGRHGKLINLVVGRGGQAASPGLVRRLLARIDQERIGADLELVSATEADEAVPAAPASLAQAWDA